MDQSSVRIGKTIQQNMSIPNNPGLMHGSTGLSIFLYNLGKKNGNPEFIKTADKILDTIFNNLEANVPLDFENGLAGIGWGIEYLIQNNFVEGNPDEILEDIDNKVFRILNEESITSFEITNGLTGYLFYLIGRLKTISSPDSIAQRINKELFILTINKIYDVVTPQFPYIVKEICFDITWRYAVLLRGLRDAFRLNIYNEKIICMIKQWLPNLEAYLPSMHINRLYLALVLKQIHSQIPDSRIERQIKILMYGTDFGVVLNEVDPNQKCLRFGLPGFLIIMNQAKYIMPLNYPNYTLLCESYQVLLKEYLESQMTIQLSDFKSEKTKFGLSEGIAGIGLLNLLLPELSVIGK